MVAASKIIAMPMAEFTIIRFAFATFSSLPPAVIQKNPPTSTQTKNTIPKSPSMPLIYAPSTTIKSGGGASHLKKPALQPVVVSAFLIFCPTPSCAKAIMGNTKKARREKKKEIFL